jgi:peptide/nickel transport system substrate-binding protein
VLDSLTDYGWNEVREEEATREMEAGGFERDSRGRWLFQEGDRAGEPMEFTITTYRWQDHVGNQGTDFRETMSDWGIDISVEVGDGHWGATSTGNFTWAAAYIGGQIPPNVMATNFGEIAAFGAGNPQLSATVEAPPVGEPDGPMQTYETRTMTDRLKVTQDDQQYQEIVDQLAWVYNQIVPRFGIEGSVLTRLVNTGMWDMKSLDENPQKLTRSFGRRAWCNGLISYNPDHSF